ncbi:MAG: PAS domain S-box protein [Proteobacteria bacterium]|nr:PAS domain S-box protein [Pseudomonadota bacterium]
MAHSQSTPSSSARHWLNRYALAFILTALSAGVHQTALRSMTASPFLIYLPSIILSGMYGGFGPGLFSTALGFAAALGFSLHPPYEYDTRHVAASLGLFAVIGGAFSYFCHLLHETFRDLQESEEKFRKLVEEVRDHAIYLVDAQGRIASWNLGAERLNGYAAAEVLGRNYALLHAPMDQAAGLSKTNLERAAKLGCAKDSGWHVRKSGERFWADTVLTAIRDERGELVGFSMVTRDMTESRRLQREEREREILAIVDAMPAFIAYIDPEERYVFNNRAYETEFGKTRESLRGQTMREAFGDQVYAVTGPQLRRALAGHRQEYESLIDYGEHGLRWMHVIYEPDRDEEGRVKGVFILASDVTSRRRTEDALRASERQLRTIIDAMPALIAYVDRDKRYVLNNRLYAEWWGKAPESLKGVRVEDFLNEKTYSIAKGYMDQAFSGKPVGFEREIEFRDKTRWVHADLLPDRDEAGEVRGLFVFTRDISSERERAHELEEAVETRTIELRRSLSDLEAFSYTVSHDLRAPLRAIQGYSYFLLERLGDSVDEESRRLLERMAGSTRRMDQLIRDLLTYSGITRDHIQLVPVDLDSVVAHVLAHYPGLEKAKITVKGPLGQVLGQESLLTQCVSNLLENAVKFVPQVRRPEMEISSARSDGKFILSIRDNGLGIESDYHEKIFEPFVRLHSSEDFEGTGIGLAIVRKAVERMGGRMGVESEMGVGSRFWIEMAEAR